MVQEHHLAIEVNEAFKTRLMAELNEVSAFEDRISYEAFSAPKLRAVLERTGKTSENFIRDLIHLIAIYQARGANATRLKDRERSRFKDPEVQTEVTNLLTRYAVVDKPAGRALTVTLPRISLCYPVISLMGNISCEATVISNVKFDSFDPTTLTYPEQSA